MRHLAARTDFSDTARWRRAERPTLGESRVAEWGMFEHIVLRRAERGEPISIGAIIEALLYYQRVHLIIDRGTLFTLIKQVGAPGVLTLLRRSDISAVYCDEILMTMTDSVGALQAHRFTAAFVSGDKASGPIHSTQDRLAFDLERLSLDKKAAHAFAKKFLGLVPVRKLSGDYFLRGGVSAAAKRDVLDTAFTKKAVRQIVSLSTCGYDPGEQFKFEVADSDLGIYAFHNIDLDGINARRAASTPPVEPLTVAFILGQIQEARGDLALAAFYSGDFVTSDVASAAIRIRHDEMLQRSGLNANAREQFAEIVLPDSPRVAEVVDAGERTLKEALLLIDQAARFKDWLKAVNPDEGLIRTYMRDVSAEGWVQRMPVKTLRYVLTLALDATYPVAGMLAGFADNFLVEKLLGGWRPNHFISSRFEPFVRAEQ